MRALCVVAGGHDDVVVAEFELLAAVDAAFAVTARGLIPWPDPHPDRPPLDEEYSRVLDAAKWRIIGARAEAWLAALVDAALAVIERDASVRWRAEPGPDISRTDRVVGLAEGALPLIVARSRIGDVDDAGVTGWATRRRAWRGSRAVGATPATAGHTTSSTSSTATWRASCRDRSGV